MEEITGTYEGEALRAARARRSTIERIARIEDKSDMHAQALEEIKAQQARHDDKLSKIVVDVADMGGQFKVIPRLVEAMEKATDGLQQREHVTFTAKVDVDKAQALGEVKIRQTKWQLAVKIVAVVGTIGTLISTAIAARGC
jgi:hypothetical protein